MVVDKIWIAEVSKSVTGNNTLEALNSVISPTTLGPFLQGIFENTSAEVVKEKDGTQNVLGTPTERAIFEFGLKLEGGHNAEDRACTRLRLILSIRLRRRWQCWYHCPMVHTVGSPKVLQKLLCRCVT